MYCRGGEMIFEDGGGGRMNLDMKRQVFLIL